MKCLIKTERLFIRLAEPEDAEDIFSYRSDFAENQFQGWFPDSVEEVRDYISNMPGTMDVANICFQVAIVLVNENRLIGDMGISFTNHNNMQAEIGCTLHKDYQKKGYATEALKAMVDYLFGTLDKHRIIASVDPRNTASIPQTGCRTDLCVYGLVVESVFYTLPFPLPFADIFPDLLFSRSGRQEEVPGAPEAVRHGR